MGDTTIFFLTQISIYFFNVLPKLTIFPLKYKKSWHYMFALLDRAHSWGHVVHGWVWGPLLIRPSKFDHFQAGWKFLAQMKSGVSLVVNCALLHGVLKETAVSDACKAWLLVGLMPFCQLIPALRSQELLLTRFGHRNDAYVSSWISTAGKKVRRSRATDCIPFYAPTAWLFGNRFQVCMW